MALFIGEMGYYSSLAMRDQNPTTQRFRCGFKVFNRLLPHAVVRGMKWRFDTIPLFVSLEAKAIKKGDHDVTTLSDTTKGTALFFNGGLNLCPQLL
ncbi:MAG: hypothetical protein OXC64_01795 [Flavobacteriaceae bacterium]|nr:hypothetical protein [Flavobacteriaceae bacterium]